MVKGYTISGLSRRSKLCLLLDRACWFETVTCLFREFVCNIWKLWEPWVSLKTTQPYNHYGFKAKDGIRAAACQFWNITSEEHQRPFDPFILHSFAREISFLHSKTCITSGCTRNKTIKSINKVFMYWETSKYCNCRATEIVWKVRLYVWKCTNIKKCICFILVHSFLVGSQASRSGKVFSIYFTSMMQT